MTERHHRKLHTLVIAVILSWAFLALNRSPGPALSPVGTESTDLAQVNAESASAMHSPPGSSPSTAAARPQSMEPLANLEPDILVAKLGLSPALFERAEAEFETQLVRLEAGDRDAAEPFATQLSDCRRLLRNRALRRLAGPEHGSKHRTSNSHLEHQFEKLRSDLPGCIPYLAHGDQALRDLLEQWGDRGNVAARAVYALWPPHRDLQHPSLESLRHWELRAMEFSLANLTAGEALGFAMFAESFSRGLFTPGNYLLGLDFRVTALRCGHTGPGAVAERLKNLLRLHSLERVPASIASMLAQRSERLRRYCRSEQWLAPDVMIELVQQALES